MQSHNIHNAQGHMISYLENDILDTFSNLDDFIVKYKFTLK